jgi:hypothetical protein
MQFYNKRHKVRERCWHKVTVTPILGGLHNPASVKQELWGYPSKGRFFTGEWYGGNLVVWFEHKSDAVWFTLKWA